MVRFYDVVYASLRDSLDYAYYPKRILEAKGPVLEVGAGTGRLLCDALSKGADIYGLDRSELMLEKLKSKLQPSEHHRITHADVRSFKLEKKFDLIIAPFRVFSHLTQTDDQVKALSSINSHLAEGGRFIFDLFLPHPEYIFKGREEKMDFEGEYEPGKALRRYASFTPDYVNQVNNVTFRHEWEEDGELKQESWSFPMRYYFRYELEHLLARTGFKIDKLYGDFQENPLENGKWEMVIECIKDKLACPR
jgi:SAM-dependent methyltransferase